MYSSLALMKVYIIYMNFARRHCTCNNCDIMLTDRFYVIYSFYRSLWPRPPLFKLFTGNPAYP
jgi:hypothetical protein